MLYILWFNQFFFQYSLPPKMKIRSLRFELVSILFSKLFNRAKTSRTVSKGLFIKYAELHIYAYDLIATLCHVAIIAVKF